MKMGAKEMKIDTTTSIGLGLVVTIVISALTIYSWVNSTVKYKFDIVEKQLNEKVDKEIYKLTQDHLNEKLETNVRVIRADISEIKEILKEKREGVIR